MSKETYSKNFSLTSLNLGARKEWPCWVCGEKSTWSMNLSKDLRHMLEGASDGFKQLTFCETHFEELERLFLPKEAP